MDTALRENLAVRAGLQNVLQIFITNAANVFLLEVSPEYPILLDEQVRDVTWLINLIPLPAHELGVLESELKLYTVRYVCQLSLPLGTIYLIPAKALENPSSFERKDHF